MVQLWETVGVYIVCVCCGKIGGAECSCVCSIFQAGGLHAYSSMRIESGFVCVNMSANLCVRVCERGQWCSVNVLSEPRLFSDSTQSN